MPVYCTMKRRTRSAAKLSQAAGRPLLVGRQTEWQLLRQAWRLAAQGEAHCVAVWGEAGIGKTRLAEEIVDWVKRQGHAAASSRSYAAKGALSYAPVTDWLRTPRLRQAVEAVDDLWRVELARLLPGLLAERPDLPQPGPLAEAWQQQRFYQAFVQLVQKVDGPLLLHLDDLQWSDGETLILLQFLLHSKRSTPLLIVLGIRSEEADDNPALPTLLGALRHAEQLTEVHLGPLSRSESVELAQQTSDDALADDDAARLYDTSEGHPLYLIETVRSGWNEGLQDVAPATADRAADGSATATGAAIPPKIYALVKTRLDQLAPSVQQVANAAAVIGRDFTYELLAATLAVDELELVDALDDLWSRRLIREQDGSGYDFSHDRIREVAYAEISRARRRLLHRQIAVALESLSQDRLDEVAGTLAMHFAQAGASDRAFVYYRQAAEVAFSQSAFMHAEKMFDAALDHVPQDNWVRFDLLHDQARVFYSTMQHQRWRQSLEERQQLLAGLAGEDVRRSMKLHVDRAHYAGTIGDGRASVDAARDAVALAERLADDAALARAYQHMAYGYWTQSRMAESVPLFERAVAYAQRAGEREIESTSLEMYAAAGMFSGMPAQAILELLTRSAAIAEARGDKRKMAMIYNKYGYLRAAAGLAEFDLIEADYQRGLALTREIGHLRTEEIILSNLGVCFTQKGDYRRAREYFEACLSVGELNPDYWRTFVARHHLGAMHMQMGQLTRACVGAESERCAQRPWQPPF